MKEKVAAWMKETLEQKPRTDKELRDEARKVGIKRSTFYFQRKKLYINGEIRCFPNVQTGEKIWTIVGKSEKANLNKISLCIDEIRSNDKRLRNLGADEFVHVCQTLLVTHDPRVRVFFKKSFNDSSLRDVHERLLLSFKYVLVRTLRDGNNDLLTELLKDNYAAIKEFASSPPIGKGLLANSIRLKKHALYILSLIRDEDVLNILYDLIKKSSLDEYNMLKAEILDIFRSYPSQFQDDIKRELFRIATKENTKENKDIIDRAITLLVDLAESRNIISG